MTDYYYVFILKDKEDNVYVDYEKDERNLKLTSYFKGESWFNKVKSLKITYDFCEKNKARRYIEYYKQKEKYNNTDIEEKKDLVFNDNYFNIDNITYKEDYGINLKEDYLVDVNEVYLGQKFDAPHKIERYVNKNKKYYVLYAIGSSQYVFLSQPDYVVLSKIIDISSHWEFYAYDSENRVINKLKSEENESPKIKYLCHRVYCHGYSDELWLSDDVLFHRNIITDSELNEKKIINLEKRIESVTSDKENEEVSNEKPSKNGLSICNEPIETNQELDTNSKPDNFISHIKKIPEILKTKMVLEIENANVQKEQNLLQILKSIKMQEDFRYEAGEIKTEINKKQNLSKPQEHFQYILSIAKNIIEKSTYVSDEFIHPIFDYLKLLAMNIQINNISDVFLQKHESTTLTDEDLFIIHKYSRKLVDEKLIDTDYKFNLKISEDVILASPWNRDRVVDNITTIGNGRKYGRWKSDYNHWVDFWLPIRIGWVHGGNHSIMVGLAQNEGTIIAENVYDMKDIYKEVFCDGENYFDKDKNIICEVQHLYFAAIYEIGRLIIKNNIKYDFR